MKTYYRIQLWKRLMPVVLGCLPLGLWANGYLLPDQDAFATARGEAFVATADNASAIYYNPAGISQLSGNNLRAGVYGISLEPSYTRPNGGPTYNNQNKLHAIPQFFYAYGQTNWPVSFGLGVYSPYGLSVEWPQDTGFRTIATEGSLTYVRINPVVALKVAPNFSIGGGVTVNYADADLKQGLVWPAQSYDQFRFTGDGWAVGYNLGALWKPQEKISIGVSFRSATTVNLKGNTSAYNNVAVPNSYPVPPFSSFSSSSSANADFNFPLNAAFGISYRPTPKWNLEFNADYTDWNSVQTLTIHQATPPPGLLPQTVQTPMNWQSSWLYEFGVTRYLKNNWQVSAGYVFNESSVPNAHYSPYVADLDRHFFSVGTGHKGKLFDFDVAYQFCYGPSRSVSGSGTDAVGQTADGSYKFTSQAVLLTLGMHF
jgi:long-chain fatty acid transport protein